MSVGFLDEREGHHSSRRLYLGIACVNATAIVTVGLALRDLAMIGAGTGLWALILPIMQWGKSLENGNGKAPG